MIDCTPGWIATAAQGDLMNAGRLQDMPASGPRRVVFDPMQCGPEDLFVGLHFGAFGPGDLASIALEQGAWGLLVTAADVPKLPPRDRPVIVVEDAVAGLKSLALAWRRELGAQVVGVTGSSGKTSTKDILRIILAQRWRVHATPVNDNNAIGVALTILGAERGTEVLVVELATRRPGGLSVLTRVAEPDLGVVVNIGPSHLSQLRSLAGVARAKAELLAALKPGSTCVTPAGESLLDPYLRDDLRKIKFGPGGDVELASFRNGVAEIDALGQHVRLELAYEQPHNVRNTLAAVGVSMALGHVPAGRIEPLFAPLRGEIVRLEGGVTLINDCYNANPLSVRAALEHLAATPAIRRLVVLGLMAGLDAQSDRHHREVGRYASSLGIDHLITVEQKASVAADAFTGESHRASNLEAATELVRQIMRPGDVILIKGSSTAKLHRIGRRLQALPPSATEVDAVPSNELH